MHIIYFAYAVSECEQIWNITCLFLQSAYSTATSAPAPAIVIVPFTSMYA